MKVVYLPGKYHHEAEALTPYKIYDVIDTDDTDYYRLINDLGQDRDYYYGRFVTLTKYRENLIEEILK